MEADPLQWLWNDVDAFRDKINDLRTRTMRNFQRPFDASQHEVDCGRNDLHSRMPCSCCKGSFTLEEVRHFKGKRASQAIQPNMKERVFKRVPVTTCWGA